MKGYNPDRGSLRNFLTCCVSTRLANLKRDRYFKQSSFLKGRKSSDMDIFNPSEHGELDDGEKKRVKLLAAKINLANPISIDIVNERSTHQQDSSIDQIEVDDISKVIEARLKGTGIPGLDKKYQDLIIGNKPDKNSLRIIRMVAQQVLDEQS